MSTRSTLLLAMLSAPAVDWLLLSNAELKIVMLLSAMIRLACAFVLPWKSEDATCVQPQAQLCTVKSRAACEQAHTVRF